MTKRIAALLTFKAFEKTEGLSSPVKTSIGTDTLASTVQYLQLSLYSSVALKVSPPSMVPELNPL